MKKRFQFINGVVTNQESNMSQKGGPSVGLRLAARAATLQTCQDGPVRATWSNRSQARHLDVIWFLIVLVYFLFVFLFILVRCEVCALARTRLLLCPSHPEDFTTRLCRCSDAPQLRRSEDRTCDGCERATSLVHGRAAAPEV